MSGEQKLRNKGGPIHFALDSIMNNSPFSPQSQLSEYTTLLITALDEVQRQERHPSVDVLWCLYDQSIVRSLCRSFLGGRCGMHSAVEAWARVQVPPLKFYSMSVKGEFRNRIRNMQNEK